jgi:hypothetical protein
MSNDSPQLGQRTSRALRNDSRVSLMRIRPQPGQRNPGAVFIAFWVISVMASPFDWVTSGED